MKNLHPDKLAAIIFSIILLQNSHQSCLSTSGVIFSEHTNAYIDAVPLAIIQVQYSSECFIACERNRKCNSVNIKQKGTEMSCELLTGDSTTSRVITSSTSSFYEIQPSSEVKLFLMIHDVINSVTRTIEQRNLSHIKAFQPEPFWLKWVS